MEQRVLPDLVKSNNTQISSTNTEFSVLLQLLEFLKTKKYGEFHVIVNTNTKTAQRSITVSIIKKNKLLLTPLN